jgi:acyl-CoA synthetase (AMP-forming)/AMP-acid ligase II
MQLWDALTDGKRGTLHVWNGKRFEAARWDDVVRDAYRIAAGLRRAGIGPGTPLAAVLTNSPLAVRGLLGAWLTGAPVASLPVPARGMSVGEYGEQLVTLRDHVGSPMIVTDERLADMLPERVSLGSSVRSWESLPFDKRIEAAPPEPDELAFVQYSSGSTAMPKGSMLTGRAIANQLDILGEMAGIAPGAETVASWLPLSHDMGVFGCTLFAWAWDFDLALSTPGRFIMSPRTWFADCADFGATLSAGPPSALGAATRAQSKLSRELRLRVCVIGAERIESGTLEAATAALSPYGLDASVWMPAYGLAEATLVVSAIGVEEEPSLVCVDTVALADGYVVELDPGSERATPIVAVGRPCGATAVRMTEPHRLSEIRVSSPSLSTGYFGDAEKTTERFRDGEFLTGDLGFQRKDQLYVVGRADDVLCVGGRNVYAREIEAAVDRLAGVRSGCSTIVDVADDGASNGVARLVMLLELRDEAPDYRALAAAAARTATAKAGITLNECVFLGKGMLPKTPSGKIQRFRCRQLLASDRLEPVARLELQGAARA